MFGTDEHPCPDPNNLKYFEKDYVLDCIDRAILAAVTEQLRERCIDIKSEVEDKWPM
jgi:hypothetical protein